MATVTVKSLFGGFEVSVITTFSSPVQSGFTKYVPEKSSGVTVPFRLEVALPFTTFPEGSSVKMAADTLGPMPIKFPWVQAAYLPATWEMEHSWAGAGSASNPHSRVKQTNANVVPVILRDIC